MLCANLPRLVSDGLINHTDEGLEEDSRFVHWHTADLFALLETNANKYAVCASDFNTCSIL